ncbi:MAG: LicD family protein [Fibrobacter sp.]|nr:LicD family protein [Fibrobacter sp.]
MKQIQVDILKDVHSFCLANGIRYTLIFGSLLGAIRHKGYIPWDDDIDIAMPREDYEKFIAEYSHKDYHVYDYRKDADYHNPYAKIADTRTLLEENVCMKSIGINVDIFPFDYMFDSKEECSAFIDGLNNIKKIFRIKLVKPGRKNVWWKRIMIRLAKVAMLPFSMKGLTEKEYQKINTLTNKDAAFVALPVDPEIDAAYRSIYPRRMFENFVKVPFGNEEFMVTADYHQWLTQMYGDYMTPPKDVDRTSPHTLSKIYWI